jgi:hypothetical protein
MMLQVWLRVGAGYRRLAPWAIPSPPVGLGRPRMSESHAASWGGSSVINNLGSFYPGKNGQTRPFATKTWPFAAKTSRFAASSSHSWTAWDRRLSRFVRRRWRPGGRWGCKELFGSAAFEFGNPALTYRANFTSPRWGLALRGGQRGRSTRDRTLGRVVSYVERQKEHHAAGRIHDRLEPAVSPLKRAEGGGRRAVSSHPA